MQPFEGIDENLTVLQQAYSPANTRGHSVKLFKDRVNKDFLELSFANRVIENWNKLPEQLVDVHSINSLKNKLGKY